MEKLPTPPQTSHKAIASGLAGSIIVLILFVLGQYFDFIQVPNDDLVNQAVIALLGAVITGAGTFAGAWFKKNYLKSSSDTTLQSHWITSLILLPLMLLLTACPSVGTDVVYDPGREIKIACDSYASSYRVLSNALIIGALSEEDEAQVDAIFQVVDPICNSPTLPMDRTSIDTVQSALTELLIYEGRIQ